MKEVTARIRKNVPMPEDNRYRWKTILEKMDVGDSFDLPPDATGYARQSINSYGRVHGKKFLVQDGVCWRKK